MEAVEAPSVSTIGLRSMFSLLTPSESSFATLQEVPQYVQQATPYFMVLMLLELAVAALKGDTPLATISDGITSISCGVFSRLPLLMFKGLELTCYIYVWDKFRLLELPWDSAWTWWCCLLGVDFCYYWVHRAAHEVSFIWAGHQVHHSSGQYNLTTALRQPFSQQITSWMFYVPLALFIPPPIFAVHIQLNLLYQFWIHTEVIRDLGPLEWILNTPKHHRVHHGRNKYCIDKNYGGILIIWDRLFGTFAEESDKVVYGLVFPIKTFEVNYVQFHYYRYLWRKASKYEGITNKILTFLYGPSWKPGKARLGDHDDNPIVTGKELPYNPPWALHQQLYVVVHFLIMLKTYHELFENKMMLSQITLLGMICYILLTLTSLGFIIDQRPRAAYLETFRCAVLIAMQTYNLLTHSLPALDIASMAFVAICLLVWGVHGVRRQLNYKTKTT